MSALLGTFLTADGKLYKVVDVWKGDESSDGEALLEDCGTDTFKWTKPQELLGMEPVDALESGEGY